MPVQNGASDGPGEPSLTRGAHRDLRLALRSARTTRHHLLWLFRSPTLPASTRAVIEAQLLTVAETIKVLRRALVGAEVSHG